MIYFTIKSIKKQLFNKLDPETDREMHISIVFCIGSGGGMMGLLNCYLVEHVIGNVDSASFCPTEKVFETHCSRISSNEMLNEICLYGDTT